MPNKRNQNVRFTDYIGHAIFVSRWLQAPLYLGLIIAQAFYVWHFMKELHHLAMDGSHMDETEVMLVVLGLVDVVMIANLLIMVIIGGYETFVSRMNIDGHPDQPEWLSHVNANVLKVKLAMAIIGISSIHLLKTFIDAAKIEPQAIMWQTIIHIAFVISAIALVYIDWLSQKSLQVSHSLRHDHQPAPPESNSQPAQV
jgi:uncharacterized protein (TIGR00645 family)